MPHQQFFQEAPMTGIPQSEHPKEKLGDFMTTPVIAIDVKATVQEAAHMMDEQNASAILTTENEKHIRNHHGKGFYTQGGGAPVIHSCLRDHDLPSLHSGPR